MQGISPFDIAAGISISLLLLGGAVYLLKKSDKGERVAGFLLFMMTLLLILWRTSCWTGHMACT